MFIYWTNYYIIAKHNGMAPIENYGGIIKPVLRNSRVFQEISLHTGSKLSAVLQLIYRCWVLNQSDATECGPSEIEKLYKSQLVAILVCLEVTDEITAQFFKLTVVFKETVTLSKLNYNIAKI